MPTHTPGHLAAGALDPAFGAGGQLLLAHGSFCDFLARQGQHTLALARDAQAFVISRFDAQGQVDARFGSAGYVLDTFAPQGHSTVSALVVAPGGAITVAGRVRLDGTWHPAVARYGVDGEPGEKTILAMPGERRPQAVSAGERVVFAFNRPASQAEDSGAYLVAVTQANAPDPSFNGNGWLELRFLNAAITLTGLCSQAGGYLFCASQGNTALVGRVLADGTLDVDFGNSGTGYFVRSRAGFSCAIHTLVAMPDGGIIAHGTEAPLDSGAPQLVIWELNRHGRPVHTSPHPLLPGLLAPRPWACAVGADGKPVLAVSAQEANDYRRAGIVARFLEPRQLDPGFAEDGVARSEPYREYLCLLPQANGDVLVGGHEMDDDFRSRAMIQQYLGR